MSKNEKHGRWKGDKVKYRGLHAWIRRHKSKPECCEKCGKKKKLELANISREYKRDINDYEYLCRSCHMIKDGVGIGHKHSKETRKKISESHKGKKLSEDHKRKLSESKRGEKHPFYGKKLSEDHKRKISETKRRNK